MSMATTKKPGLAASVVDLTPPMVSNWSMASRPPAVLIVNPAATLHERCALAWLMAAEAHTIADAGMSRRDPANAAELMPVLEDRLRQLTVLLSDIGDITSKEGGQAERPTT